MKKVIAVLPGDGIGKEVTKGAVEVLKAVAERYGHTFQFEYGLIGGRAIDETGSPLPEETLLKCLETKEVHDRHQWSTTNLLVSNLRIFYF